MTEFDKIINTVVQWISGVFFTLNRLGIDFTGLDGNVYHISLLWILIGFSLLSVIISIFYRGAEV